jgi:hypothetical protein
MHMNLWQRAPREVYRVYGEDEFLAEDRAPSAEHTAPVGESPSIAHPGRTGAMWPSTARLLGLGLLLGVSVVALGLVLLNASHRHAASHAEATDAGVPGDTRSDMARPGASGDRAPVHLPVPTLMGAGHEHKASSGHPQLAAPEAVSMPASLHVRAYRSSQQHEAPAGQSCCTSVGPSSLQSSSSRWSPLELSEASSEVEFDFER